MSDDYDPVSRVVRSLLSTEKVGDQTIVRLPLIMPSGSMATVRVIENNGDFFIGDLGLSYLQAESLGLARNYWRVVKPIIEKYVIDRSKEELFIRVKSEDLYSGICDVAMASWQAADVLADKADETANVELSESVVDRLVEVFGTDRVVPQPEIMGHSHISWPMTAIVKNGSRSMVFQAVSNHAQSVYRANTAFHDLSILDDPPILVSVVRDKQELGEKISLLSQTSKVIETDANAEVYRRLVA